MTRIIIHKTSAGEYAGFSCSGHAGYSQKGTDIVCAALSLLTINTVNSLEQLTGEGMEVTSDEAKGLLCCRFTGRISPGGQLLMDSYVMGCREVFHSYGSKYMKLEFKEV